MKHIPTNSNICKVMHRKSAKKDIVLVTSLSDGRLLVFLSLIMVFLFILLAPPQVHAVPSFKRQTGMSCNACHTIFPELTPFGRSFKINGYVFSNNNKPFVERIPIAAMIQMSYTEQRGLDNRFDPFDNSSTAKFNLPQEASVFYAGRIAGNFGAFSQLTYNGVDNSLSLDNTDIRYANNTTVVGAPLVYGVTINNNPTVADAWNSTPAWGFSYSSSEVALTPAASTIIDNTLAQQVGGAGVYLFWNRFIYAEIDAYGTTDRGLARILGAGTTPDTIVSGVVPYGRLALQYQHGSHSFGVGTYGLVADIYPSGLSSGGTDRFTDYAFDGHYQFIKERHMLLAQTTWIHERQEWDASYPLGMTAHSSDDLETWKINLSYHYRSDFGIFGGIAAYVSTTGDNDPILYAPGELTGSRTGNPDSKMFILQADYSPRENIKIVAQYVIYDKFNGADMNYDGSGRNASDNNTLYLLLWLAL